MKNKVTIEEIAEKANVSVATVSRIINNKSNVRPDTRRRVMEVMEELHFSPKPCSPLSDANSRTILMCVPDFDNPFNSTVIDGIQKAARSEGYTVMLMQDLNHCFGRIDYESILKSNSIAGIIIFCSIPNSKFLEELSFRCPVVICSEYAETPSVSHVGIDDKKAARTAMNYLISTGCRKIGLMNCNMKFKYAQHREKGYYQALENAGLSANPDWIVHISTISYQLAYSNALHVLSLPNRPDSIFACSDVFALAIVNAAKKLNLKVPDDISVVGFDNVYLSTMADPPITTIEQPSYQLGLQACELLLEKIKFPNASSKQIILDTELIVRKSTKLPAAFSSK